MFRIDDQERVRVLVIDNPDRKNAIPPQGWTQLAEVLRGFEESEQRALIITGAGEDFCSGADLGDGGSAAASSPYQMMTNVARAASALRSLTKPTVAAVRGVAVGAGMNMALGCDIVYATPDARFSEIFVRRGLSIDFGGSWLLPRLVGLATAKELALTGRMVSGREAKDLGLVARLVEDDELLEKALETAAALADGAPLAQRFIKAALERGSTMSFEEALAFEDQAQAICIGSEDFAEGVGAFMERREPKFRGR